MLITKHADGAHVCAYSMRVCVLKVCGFGRRPILSSDPVLGGTVHQKQKATLFWTAVKASGAPSVTTPMSQPAPWNTGNVPRRPVER